MNADSVINTHTSRRQIGTLPNGDTFWIFGPYRERYSVSEKALYFEVLSGGKWYYDPADVLVDSEIDPTGWTVSPIQEII